MTKTPTITDKRRWLRLLREQQSKANRKKVLSDTSALREGWNQVGLALGWVIELAEADLAREVRS